MVEGEQQVKHKLLVTMEYDIENIYDKNWLKNVKSHFKKLCPHGGSVHSFGGGTSFIFKKIKSMQVIKQVPKKKKKRRLHWYTQNGENK